MRRRRSARWLRRDAREGAVLMTIIPPSPSPPPSSSVAVVVVIFLILDDNKNERPIIQFISVFDKSYTLLSIVRNIQKKPKKKTQETMGCTSSQPDIGFDWWVLLKRKKYDGIQNLIQAKSQTCLQPLPKTTNNLLLHSLCDDPEVPLSLIHVVLAAHKEVTMMPNDDGKLPLHIACGQDRGQPQKTTQLILALISANGKACGVGIIGEQAEGQQGQGQGSEEDKPSTDSMGNLPLHELLASRSRVDIESVGTMLLEIYPDAVKEKRGRESTSKPARYPLEIGLFRSSSNSSNKNQEDKENRFMVMMLDIYPAAVKECTAPKPYPSLIHWALSTNKPADLTMKLINAYPAAVRMKNKSGQLPIHIGCDHGDVTPTEIIQRLLALYPACLVIQDNKGNTPLHAACEKLHNNLSFIGGCMIECAEASDACKKKNNGGNLPIHSICEQRFPAEDVIMYMIDVYPESLQQKDKAGNLPLHR